MMRQRNEQMRQNSMLQKSDRRARRERDMDKQRRMADNSVLITEMNTLVVQQKQYHRKVAELEAQLKTGGGGKLASSASAPHLDGSASAKQRGSQRGTAD